jgi:IclR family transcriptional regulator, KDG regulon repressor
MIVNGGKAKGKQLINSLVRGMVILETIYKNGSIGVTEMSKILNVNKSSAHRLIHTLENMGYVEQEAATARFKLGLRFLKYGEKVLDDMTIREIARPFLKELTIATKESSHLGVLFQNQVLFVDRENSKELVSVRTNPGMSEPLHCSAMGKALLSSLPNEEQNKILGEIDFNIYTNKTISDIGVMKNELMKTRQQGYAFDDEELYPGVRCLASPIMDYSGKVIAAIGISGPVIRIKIENLQDYVISVVGIAKAVSDKFGYSG